jgi:hypothetical protein
MRGEVAKEVGKGQECGGVAVNNRYPHGLAIQLISKLFFQFPHLTCRLRISQVKFHMYFIGLFILKKPRVEINIKIRDFISETGGLVLSHEDVLTVNSV